MAQPIHGTKKKTKINPLENTYTLTLMHARMHARMHAHTQTDYFIKA